MAFPTLKRVQSAFTKAGAIITEFGKNNGYKAVKGNNTVIFYFQEGFPDRTIPVVSLMFTSHPDTDSMSDYNADTFYHTIKEAVSALNAA
jgi:hypothetical protein